MIYGLLMKLCLNMLMGVTVVVLIKGMMMGVDGLIIYNRVLYQVKGILMGVDVLINYNRVFSLK